MVTVYNSTSPVLFQNVTWERNLVVGAWGRGPLYVTHSRNVTVLGCNFLNNSAPSSPYQVTETRDDDDRNYLVTRYWPTSGGGLLVEESDVIVRER